MSFRDQKGLGLLKGFRLEKRTILRRTILGPKGVSGALILRWSLSMVIANTTLSSEKVVSESICGFRFLFQQSTQIECFHVLFTVPIASQILCLSTLRDRFPLISSHWPFDLTRGILTKRKYGARYPAEVSQKGTIYLGQSKFVIFHGALKHNMYFNKQLVVNRWQNVWSISLPWCSWSRVL